MLVSSLCQAQAIHAPLRNALSAEVGKTGLIFNLSLDHKPAQRKYGFRLVAGSNFAHYLNAFVAGAGGYYLAGKATHFFEMGLDLQYLVVDRVSDDQKRFALLYPDYSIKTFYPSLNAG